MSKRLKPTPEMQEQICKAIAEEEQPEIIAANKAQGRKVFDELQQRQQEFADVVTALRVARETRALSLQDICDRIGITCSSLSQLEKGRGKPTMTTLRRVAEAIGVEILVTVK